MLSLTPGFCSSNIYSLLAQPHGFERSLSFPRVIGAQFLFYCDGGFVVAGGGVPKPYFFRNSRLVTPSSRCFRSAAALRASASTSALVAAIGQTTSLPRNHCFVVTLVNVA